MLHISHVRLSLVPLLLLFLALSACGGGGGGGDGDTNTGDNGDSALTGQFIDSAVANMNYEAESYSGITDAQGTFIYKEGELITFRLGEAFIGHAYGAPLLTPYDLLGETFNNVDPLAVALLLQSVDKDGNPENGIVLPTTNLQALPASIDFSDPTKVEQAITDLSFSPLDINQVESHLMDSLANTSYAHIIPGDYENTVNQSYVEIKHADGRYKDSGYFETCPVEFSSADFEVTEISIAGTLIGVDGLPTAFNIPNSGERWKDHVTDTGVLLSIGGKTEYLVFILHQPGSDCYTRLYFDRVNGEVMPPTGYSEGTRSLLINTGNITAQCKHSVDIEARYHMEDRDGWITRATLTWAQDGGGSGVINLLAENADNQHFMTNYRGTENVVTGVVTKWWVGYGLYADFPYTDPISGSYAVKGYENRLFNQSNPRTLWGLALMRGIKYKPNREPDANGVIRAFVVDGNVTVTYHITDNDGKNFIESKTYLTSNSTGEDPSCGTGGTGSDTGGGILSDTYYHKLYYEVDNDPTTDPVECVDVLLTPSASVFTVLNYVDRWTEGRCPSLGQHSCVYDALEDGTIRSDFFTDLQWVYVKDSFYTNEEYCINNNATYVDTTL